MVQPKLKARVRVAIEKENEKIKFRQNMALFVARRARAHGQYVQSDAQVTNVMHQDEHIGMMCPHCGKSVSTPLAEVPSGSHPGAKNPFGKVKRQALGSASQNLQYPRVPAFGPLTKVHSPLVSRAQWEVVVRSFILAGIIAWAVVGGLVALPVENMATAAQV